MKKIFLFAILASALLFASCASTGDASKALNNEKIKKVASTSGGSSGGGSSNGTNGTNEYYFSIGDSIEISNKILTLNNVGSGGNVMVTVDGISKVVVSNGTTTVNGLDVTVVSFVYTDNVEGRSAVLHVIETELSSDEYFLNVGDSISVNGKVLTLDNVGSGGNVMVTVDGISKVVVSTGRTTVNGLDVSVISFFYDDNFLFRAAVLHVVETPAEAYTLTFNAYGWANRISRLTDNILDNDYIWAQSMLIATPSYPDVISHNSITCQDKTVDLNSVGYFEAYGTTAGTPYSEGSRDKMWSQVIGMQYPEGTPITCFARFSGTVSEDYYDYESETFVVNSQGARFTEFNRVIPLIEAGTNKLMVFVEFSSPDASVYNFWINPRVQGSSGSKEEVIRFYPNENEFTQLISTNLTVTPDSETIFLYLRTNAQGSVGTSASGSWDVGAKSSVTIDGQVYPTKFVESISTQVDVEDIMVMDEEYME